MATAAPDPGSSPAHAPHEPTSHDELAGSAVLDLDRRRRTGIPEVIFAERKTVEQTLLLLQAQRRAEPGYPAFATRCPARVLAEAPVRFPEEQVISDPVARTVLVGAPPPPRGRVAVVTAGTSDLPVAREALATLQALGVGSRLVADVGVAGIGRLLRRLDLLADVDCVIAVAGMEGALPGVVAGLVAAPVLAVPTSVGYGVSAGGQVAAAAMLASCAPGLSVVNIDNGFGAAAQAAKIVTRVHGR